MKKGMEVEIDEENKGNAGEGETTARTEPEMWKKKDVIRRTRKVVKKPQKVEGPFVWTDEQDSVFQSINHEIVTNAIALPDPDHQYQLAVDASKKGIGGALFQLEGISAHTEATNSLGHRAAERMIMFISFKLEDAEARYSNSEREALAVIRCLTDVRRMVISLLYLITFYMDHEELRVRLTGLDNDAHGRIAKWQQWLGEYNFRLLHRAASSHSMGIAHGRSRLPSRLMQSSFVEDSDGLRPSPSITVCRQAGINIETPCNAFLAVS